MYSYDYKIYMETKMKLTLNKANKILKTLETELNRLRYEMSMPSFKETTLSYNKITNIELEMKKIVKKVEENKKIFENFMFLEIDVYNIRCALNNMNIEVGISTILKDIARLYEFILIYENLDRYFTTHNYTKASEVERIISEDISKMQSSDEVIEKKITVSVVEGEENLKDTIKSTKKQLSELEDKKFELNNSVKIDVALSKAAEEFLGL